MKFILNYIIKVSVIIALAVFVIEQLVFGNQFQGSFQHLLKLYGVHFMYAFVLVAINGTFFEKLEKKYPWKQEPKKRLIFGAIGSVFLTMLGLAILRYITLTVINNGSFSDFLNDPHALSFYLFGLTITIIISLIFHAIFFYKTISEKKVEEQTIVAKTETAKFETLKSQIDPHFLFNSLNVLTSLIGENPSQAERFTTKLSQVYRYVLEQKNKDIVSLDEELRFAKIYMELLKMRFEDALTFDIPEKSSNPDYKIIPLSLQLLLENTIKHNAVSEENPLNVVIKEDNGYLVISNNFNPKTSLDKGTKVGLRNIEDRYKLITLKRVAIENTGKEFRVALPLLTQRTKTMKTTNTETTRYLKAVEQVEEIKGFYASLLAYVIVIPFLVYIYNTYTPNSIQWFWFPAMGWGIGLIFQGLKAFNLNPILGRNWEERKLKEFMEEEERQYWD